jgi:predicted Zn-dependent peptidase
MTRTTSMTSRRPPAAAATCSAARRAARRGTGRAARVAAIAAGLTLALAAGEAAAATGAVTEQLRAFEGRTTVHVVANGWTFILVERPTAPVFSFCTVADVGSSQEVPGITGLAHMFEHMAFKGTARIGTRDPAAEQAAMDAEEAAYLAYQTERQKLARDAARVAALAAEFKRREADAEKLVVKNELDDILARAGAVGVNADTGADQTEYYYSLPSNEIELFAYIESERFWHPVFREFYEERDVVQEERRMRVDGDPGGRLYELLVSTAFAAHPYHQPTIGYMSDLEAITRTDAEAFFRAHYVPASLVTAIVGDIHPQTLIPLLDKYFGRIPARPPAPPLRTVEPPQAAEKDLVLVDPAQPQVLAAYHRPAVTHPDDAVYDAIDDILSGGRTSRLYRALVRDKKLAVEVESFSGLPGEKYPNLWTVAVVPAVGVSAEQVLAGVDAELDRLRREDVTDAELAKFRTRARASILRSLGSNLGIATALAHYQILFGDWRELFHEIDQYNQVTRADIRRVAGTLVPANRTLATLVTQDAAATAAPAATGADTGGDTGGEPGDGGAAPEHPRP